MAFADGLLVICEKPFTPTFQEADELVALSKKHNKLLAVYQSTSFLELYPPRPQSNPV